MLKKLLILMMLLIASPLTTFANTNLLIEAGHVENTFNKVKIDGEEGSLFNLAPALNDKIFYRLSLIHKFNSPHGFRLLYAPLKFNGDKRFSKDINFGGVNFISGKKTDVEYSFNSYRGTYFYEVIAEENLLVRLGGTLKIRDAKIELSQDDRKKFKKNTGIVPLFYLYSEYKWDNGFIVAFDFDGLAAPQGRAFDMALMGGYAFSPSYQMNLGFRMLEGGVDNEKVYNFSQINYSFASLQINF